MSMHGNYERDWWEGQVRLRPKTSLTAKTPGNGDCNPHQKSRADRIKHAAIKRQNAGTRTCQNPDCTTKLSIYNSDTFCASHTRENQKL